MNSHHDRYDIFRQLPLHVRAFREAAQIVTSIHKDPALVRFLAMVIATAITVTPLSALAFSKVGKLFTTAQQRSEETAWTVEKKSIIENTIAQNVAEAATPQLPSKATPKPATPKAANKSHTKASIHKKPPHTGTPSQKEEAPTPRHRIDDEYQVASARPNKNTPPFNHFKL